VSGSDRASVPGVAIVVASWVGTALVAACSIPVALGVEALSRVSMVVSLGVFFAAIALWVWVFLIAAARSSAGENVAVANLFLFDAQVPRAVRLHLFGALAASVILTLAVAARDPFTVLTPMWGLGCCGLWGARHGTYGPRPDLRR